MRKGVAAGDGLMWCLSPPSEIDLLAQGSHGQFYWGLLSGRPPGATTQSLAATKNWPSQCEINR